MDIIVFTPVPVQLHKLNTDVFNCLPTEDNIEIFRTLEDFFKRLHKPKRWDSIIIVCPASRDELEKISVQKDLFINTRVVLILPDRSEETIACGCGFYPRFSIFADQDFKDIVAVLQKMRMNFYACYGKQNKITLKGGESQIKD